jgi:hypothetical protein
MRARLTALMVLCVALQSCSGIVYWTARKRVPEHRISQDIIVYVAVSPLVANIDDGGNVAAVIDGLERELKERGRTVSIVGARLDEPAPVPRVELQFQLADAGHPGMRGAGQLANLIGTPAGVSVVTIGDSSEVLVDVYAVPAAGGVTFSGRIRASNWGSTTGHDTVAASESAGRAIAQELTR